MESLTKQNVHDIFHLFGERIVEVRDFILKKKENPDESPTIEEFEEEFNKLMGCEDGTFGAEVIDVINHCGVAQRIVQGVAQMGAEYNSISAVCAIIGAMFHFHNELVKSEAADQKAAEELEREMNIDGKDMAMIELEVALDSLAESPEKQIVLSKFAAVKGIGLPKPKPRRRKKTETVQ
jgi:hypothetical protein